MKFTPLPLLLEIVVVITLSSCQPPPKAPIGFATVNADHSSLRSRNSATSPTLKVLEPGERVELLDQEDRWFRVRAGETEGWMEISTILTDETREKIEQALAEAQLQPSQNTGTLRQDANLRLNPGRTTSVLRRVPARTAVEVLERRTLPREDIPDREEAWLKVRTKTDAGWLLASFVDFDVPEEISRYTEDFIYSTVRTVNEIQDPTAGTVRWYIVGERRPGTGPEVDFTGVRVFTWNQSKQRYETAYRSHDLRGIYPLEVGKDEAGKPTFRIHELSAEGGPELLRDFEMNGVVVREIKKRPG